MEDAGIHIKTPHHALTVVKERADAYLVTQSWVSDKPCLATIDTEAYMTVARPNITARWPKRQLNQCYTLQMVSGEALPILNEVFLTLAPGRCPLKIWVFVINISNEFILGLDILPIYDVSVDLGSRMLHPAEKRYCQGAPAFQPGSGQCSGDTCTMGGSCDGSIGEPPWSGKWSGRTVSGSPRSRWTLYRHKSGLRLPGSTCEGTE